MAATSDLYTGYHVIIVPQTPAGDSLVDDSLDAVKTALVAGTAVIGKARLVTATGDEVTEDTGNTVKVSGTFWQTTQPVSEANSSNVSLGTTTDAPADAVQDGTARTGITLFKTISNYLKTVAAWAFGFDSTNVLKASTYGKGTAAGDTPLTFQSAASPNLRVGIYSGADQAATSSPNADGRSASSVHLLTQNYGYLYNGTTWDRIQGNREATVLANAARTATTASADQTLYNSRSVVLIVNIASIVDTPSITPTLQIKDSISGNYFTIWTAAAALTAAGTYAYLFALGGAGSAGSFTEAVAIPVTRTWRVNMVHADADSATYSVSSCALVG